VGGLWNDGTLGITAACLAAVSGNAAGAGRNGQGTGPAASDNDLRGPAAAVLDLSVAVSGAGSVSAGATPTPFSGGINTCTSAGGAACTATYLETTPAGNVTLAASAAPGQILAQWGGACSGSAPDCTVAMDQARAVTAQFVPVVTTFSGTTVPPAARAGRPRRSSRAAGRPAGSTWLPPPSSPRLRRRRRDKGCRRACSSSS
jgi:hypothetical protein